MHLLSAAFTLLAVVAAAPQVMKMESLVPAKTKHEPSLLNYERVLEPGIFEQHWQNFRRQYNKKYASREKESRRKEIFKNNLKKIQMHNYLHATGKSSYKLGINEYAGMETKEFTSVMNGYRVDNKTYRSGKPANSVSSASVKTVVLPEQIDWRENGCVTPVKKQGHCGACWSFSATGALEGQHAIKRGDLVSLSEQNLVDCSGPWGNEGCSGGNTNRAFLYIRDNNGVDTEESYPYVAEEEECRFSRANVGATDQGFVSIPQGDEYALKEATATVGPIAVAVDASLDSFRFYSAGVYDDPMCSDETNHGVLVVGYGTLEGQAYWLVKNSWGASWGDEGYIKIARNNDNQCGIANVASYPVV